jgi:hypothetical protein
LTASFELSAQQASKAKGILGQDGIGSLTARGVNGNVDIFGSKLHVVYTFTFSVQEYFFVLPLDFVSATKSKSYKIM